MNPVTMREYETIAILRPDLLEEGVERLKGRVAQVIEKMEGRLIRFDNWGKRKLAYEVHKQTKGIYLYFLYLGSPGTAEELERNLKMWDDAIRFMTVKVDEDVDPTVRPTEISEDELDRAARAAAKNYTFEELHEMPRGDQDDDDDDDVVMDDPRRDDDDDDDDSSDDDEEE